jgi:polyhydroxyalkanoate synthase subunit PhaC
MAMTATMLPFAQNAWPSQEVLLVGLLIIATIATLLWWAHLWYWDRKLRVVVSYALEERIPTADGCLIELRRVVHPDTTAPDPGLPPVLLVHGLGANHRNQDLHPDYSLARYLSARGRDVWLVTLRSGVRSRTRAQNRLVRFVNMVQQDVPLAVQGVLARTGHAQLDYVGFSMGGMLLYAAIARSLPEAQVRRAVVIGSPAVVRTPFPVPFASGVGQLLRRMPLSMALRFWARTGAFAAEWFPTPLHRALFNPLNVSKGITRMAMANLVEDVPGPLYYEFFLWGLSKSGELSLDGSSVLESLADLRIPALFFAGAADRLAPPAAVRVAYEFWARNQPDVPKRFVLLGREAGAREDYGHGDLAVGAHVRRDIFEPLADFLEAAG